MLRIKDWDPRRDGVGAELNRPTVYRNAHSTRKRWTIVPWSIPGDARTSLSQGIAPGTTELIVDSIFSLPGTHSLPYDVTLGEEPANEDVRVVRIRGSILDVRRARNGTSAIIHEAGTSVEYKLPEEQEPWDGIVVTEVSSTGRMTFKGVTLWPAGEAWADKLLTRMSQPQRRINMRLVNREDAWATVQLGSRHNINVETEGDGPITGVVRVIGYAPSFADGTMELIVEVV